MLSRQVKTLILNCVEVVWAFGFAVAGRIFRPKPAHWSSPSNQRILVLAPHPDDEVIGCAGTILLHIAQGDAVTVVYITDGRRSRALGLNAAQMTQRRKQEAQAAIAILDCDRVWLGFPENEWEIVDLQPQLTDLLTRLDPHIIYAPSRVDFHPEHHKVAHALATQLSSDTQAIIRIYQIHVPLTITLVNLIAPTATVHAQKQAALEAYTSQHESVFKAMRMQHYAARFYRVDQQVECFWQLSASAYRQLHIHPLPWTGNFRSVYPRPFTDPLAYLYGAFARRQLVECIHVGHVCNVTAGEVTYNT